MPYSNSTSPGMVYWSSNYDGEGERGLAGVLTNGLRGLESPHVFGGEM